jgi:hypothetical protein
MVLFSVGFARADLRKQFAVVLSQCDSMKATHP